MTRLQIAEHFLGGDEPLAAFPRLAAAWAFSRERLQVLQAALAAALSGDQCRDLGLAVAGSYGRLEASEVSDLDFLVVTLRPLEADVIQAVYATTAQVVQALGMACPNPKGVFAPDRHQDLARLLAVAGAGEDTLDMIAQRLLMLMECRVVYGPDACRQAADALLEHYLGLVERERHKAPVYLLNDAIRYFRTICVNYQFQFWNEREKWALRHSKLRHSRVVMYAGLLLRLLNYSRQSNGPDYLRSMLDLTPLERICAVYRALHDDGYRRLLAAYDLFLEAIHDDAARNTLQYGYDERYRSPAYRQMRVTAGVVSAELTRFVYAHREQWGEAMLEYLTI
ncbi:MAG: hypothetical protein IT204_04840 [Fimbriimonadaceae bacterium]|nr:hypothetical protein [Fimbriimonadaceae bacterium]